MAQPTNSHSRKAENTGKKSLLSSCRAIPERLLRHLEDLPRFTSAVEIEELFDTTDYATEVVDWFRAPLELKTGEKTSGPTSRRNGTTEQVSEAVFNVYEPMSSVCDYLPDVETPTNAQLLIIAIDAVKGNHRFNKRLGGVQIELADGLEGIVPILRTAMKTKSADFTLAEDFADTGTKQLGTLKRTEGTKNYLYSFELVQKRKEIVSTEETSADVTTPEATEATDATTPTIVAD